MTDKWLLIVILSIFIDELEVFQSQGQVAEHVTFCILSTNVISTVVLCCIK